MVFAANAQSRANASRRPGTASRRAHLRVQAVAAPVKTSAPAPSSSAARAVCPEVAKDLYYDMVLGREFEEMCAQMYYRGKMFGFVHLYSGQEAVSSGVIRALQPRDYVCSTYRDHVHALSKGVSARSVS
jgi:pyruvate dehydrogenase E1 component alpha subunit